MAAACEAMRRLGEVATASLDRIHAARYPGLTREQFERRMGFEAQSGDAKKGKR